MMRTQRGQALVLGLVMAALGLIGLVGMVNLGQLALARSRLTQATDAAAYSGAVIQARTLNLLAHVQRAQVGHQVAIAHLVTLGAWASFGHAQGQRFGRGNPPGVAIGIVFGPAHASAYANARAMLSDHRASLSRAIAGHDGLTHGVLASSARQLVRSLPALRAAVIQQVLSENLPRLDVAGRSGAAVQFQVLNDSWPTALAPASAKTSAAGRGLVEAAAGHYRFLGPRQYNAWGFWPVSHRCPVLRHNLRRRGSTWLDVKGQWRAVDTQSFHKLRSNKWIGCYYREYAMGWGVARVEGRGVGNYSNDAPDDFSDEPFWKWVQRQTDWDIASRRDNPLSNSYGMRRPWRPALKGLTRPFEWALAQKRSTGFTLQVTQRGSTVNTFDGVTRMMPGAGRFSFDGIARDGKLSSLASAEAYFLRAGKAASHTGGRADATAFRPYWRARLTETMAQRNQARATR